MSTILEKLAEAAKKRCEQAKQDRPLEELIEIIDTAPKRLPPFAFEQALGKEGLSVIAEIKQASPSKGQIADPDTFDPVQIAKDYQNAGASCISVLSEPKWFKGSLNDVQAVSQAVSVPLLRKDFTVDPYMIYEAKAYGADAILLICSILNDEELVEYLLLAESLGLSALVECHDKTEIDRALKAGARIIGVNNRNLKTFDVDVSLAGALACHVPKDVLFVSESGAKTPEDFQHASEYASAILAGEVLMRAEDKGKRLKELQALL